MKWQSKQNLKYQIRQNSIQINEESTKKSYTKQMKLIVLFYKEERLFTSHRVIQKLKDEMKKTHTHKQTNKNVI